MFENDTKQGSAAVMPATLWLTIALLVGCAALTPLSASADGGSAFAPQTRSSISQRATEAFTQPYRQVELAAAEPGRIATIHIRRGSRVAQNELLVELDCSTLQASRNIAEQRSQSTAKKEALQVEHERKVRMFEAVKALSEEGAGTEEELLEAEAAMRIAQLNIREADESLERAALEVAEIDAKIESRRIRAQMSGVIVEMHREVGEYVSSVDAKVATLVDLSRLRASFFLPTEIALKYQEEQKTQVRFVQTERHAGGIVEYVGPLTHADSGRVRVDILIDNRQFRFRSGVRCVLQESSEPARDANRERTAAR